MISYLVPVLSHREVRYLDSIIWHFDDNCEYIASKKRQNRIGSHYFKANTSIAKVWGMDESSVREMLISWKELGWIEDAKNVPGFENDPVYEKFKNKVNRKDAPPHLLMNVSMLCRFLSVHATLNEAGLNKKHERAKIAIQLAATKTSTDFTDPTVDSFTSPEYHPPTFTNYLLHGSDTPPKTWEDLFKNEENLEEARELEVDPNTSTKPSQYDDSITVLELAKTNEKEPKLEDKFPLKITYISDVTNDYVDVVFHMEDITEKGVLDYNSYLPSDDDEKESYLDETYGVVPKIASFNEEWGEEMLEFIEKKSQEKQKDKKRKS